MLAIIDRFRRWIAGEDEAHLPDDPERLRLDFQARYHQFRLLLAANQRALDLMAEIERALTGTAPFGMTFVRSRCTRVSTQVFAIVRHMNALGGDRYASLYERFKAIQRRINPHVHPPGAAPTGELVLPLSAVGRRQADQVGAKLATLGDLAARPGTKVPPGFVVTAAGYAAFMAHNDLQPEINRRLQAADARQLDQLHALSADIQALISRAPLPDRLETAIRAALADLEATAGPDLRLAVRSSALGEDLAGATFAGQYRSELNVPGEQIFQAYRDVVASKYGVTAMSYRLNRGLRDEDVAMCVGCMQMVPATASGVLYTRNPLDLRDDAVIVNSVWGLPKSVVDGSGAADIFVVDRAPAPTLRRSEIRTKAQKFVCYPDEGVCRLEANKAEQDRPSLTEDQVLALARLAVAIESEEGQALDMEWAQDPDGAVVLLQCRPLQQVAPPSGHDPEATATAATGQRPLLAGGVTAAPGVGAGPVFSVRKDADMLRFPEGAVLVAAQALPRWASLLGRAAAVVTAQGDITGHLANVAREFGVPALFAVPDLLETLTAAQTVTVDADARRVYDGRVEGLLPALPRARNHMADSPVLKALQAAAAQITPLTLIDPDAPAFRADNCQTFHDITRYCHEKAVVEMFRFGRDHHFPEHSSKQLVCEVPMQWWVLNLDDGFRQEEPGRRVHIDNIVSIPMRALWQGITAVAWEGPPPVDGRGMMAVMFQATANRALVPTVRSSYANRNYFMLSRHYCCLQSRLGFHFSTIEALAGPRTVENYASFHFKGGAADFDRRRRRVHLIQELLEGCGFRVALRADALSARFEQQDQAAMERVLRQLGYLVIHTRQLDMVMANPGAVDHYRRRLAEDLARVGEAKNFE